MTKTTSSAAADVIAQSKNSGPNYRVRPGRENFRTEKQIGLHFKSGKRVESPTTFSPFAMTPSELELAKFGTFWKWKLHKGSDVAFHDFEKSLLHDMFEKDEWIGVKDGALQSFSGYPGGDRKALLDDATSGGSYLIPQWQDSLIAHYALLYGELLPHVTVREVPYGASVAGATMGQAVITSNTAEGSSASTMSTASLVGNMDTTIYDCSCFLEVGRNLLVDVPVIDLGKDLLAEMGAAYLEWCDNQIANGDGTTEPEGIFTKSGTTTVASANGTSGPFTIGDIEELMFSVGKARRKGYPCFVTSERMYRRARQVPVSTSDDRRLFGMDHMDYRLFEFPAKIQDDITNGRIAFCNLAKYRWYRRPGPVFDITTAGETLTLKHTALLSLRARVGGQLERGHYAAKITDGPQTG